MKIALLGYGKMGQMIDSLSSEYDAEVIAKYWIDSPLKADDEKLNDIDVCIDFSTPEAVITNLETCIQAGKSLVVGTTGWGGRLDYIRNLVEDAGTGFVYGSNFSTGVNLFYRIAEYAGKLLKSFDGFDPFIFESHHKFKLDAPSGTALTLKSKVSTAMNGREIPVSSVRAGYIPGTHELGFDSQVDSLKLSHVARSREGFARGALTAAAWIREKTGFYEFSEVLDSIIKSDLK